MCSSALIVMMLVLVAVLAVPIYGLISGSTWDVRVMRVVDRSEDPFAFWTALAGYGILELVFAGFLIRAVMFCV